MNFTQWSFHSFPDFLIDRKSLRTRMSVRAHCRLRILPQCLTLSRNKINICSMNRWMQKPIVLRLLGEDVSDLFISACIACEQLAHLSSVLTQLSFRDFPDIRCQTKINEQTLLFCPAVPTGSADWQCCSPQSLFN